jgi:hypothetical protein
LLPVSGLVPGQGRFVVHQHLDLHVLDAFALGVFVTPETVRCLPVCGGEKRSRTGRTRKTAVTRAARYLANSVFSIFTHFSGWLGKDKGLPG